MSKWRVTFQSTEYRWMEVEADNYEAAIATADRSSLTNAKPLAYDGEWYAQMIEPYAQMIEPEEKEKE